MAAERRSGSKEGRRVARTLVATYHEAELAGLVERVAERSSGTASANSTYTTSTR
jgi:hypothetical protein